jgi:mannose-P-dolichol utilization defect protein 1
MANFKQGHTGQVAILSIFLKLVGCLVRMFTTVTQIGLDPGLLLGYTTGAVMNGIIVAPRP